MSEFSMYVVRGSLDQTEGRTGYVDREFFSDLDLAIKVIKSGKWAVQGVPAHSELVERTFVPKDGRFEVNDVMMWGHHKSRDGKWRHGWVDDRDVAKFTDPEFETYLRLKERFEGDG